MRLVIVGALLGLSVFWWFVSFELRAAANEDLLIKDMTISGVTDRPPKWRVFKPSDFIPFETRAATNADILVEDVIIPGVTDRISEGDLSSFQMEGFWDSATTQLAIVVSI
ncbi:MAG: hypothetical protein RBJ76_17780 [Stenomitos frigidus ULC029]